MRAGDVVVGDARLLHSAHANRSGERRTVLTIWYWPAYDELPEEVQALIAGHVTDHPYWCEWVEENRFVLGELMPAWSNTAGPGLK